MSELFSPFYRFFIARRRLDKKVFVERPGYSEVIVLNLPKIDFEGKVPQIHE
jgi:hypothetical protein